MNTSPGTTSNSLELDMTLDDPESTESEGNYSLSVKLQKISSLSYPYF